MIRCYARGLSILGAGVCLAQEAADPRKPAAAQEPPDKRVFGVLPNYRTANESPIYTPISAKQKFIIGSKDSFDYPLVLLAGTLAGVGQLSDQHPSFGQGTAGFA